MADGCWCNLKIHLPGELARHKRASKEAKQMLALAEQAGKRGKNNGNNS